MSYFGGKPFIDRCLNSLSDSEIGRLRSIINNSNALPTGNYCLYGPSGVKLTDVLSDYNEFVFVNLGYDWILNYYHIGFLIRLGTNEWAFLVWQPYSLLMTVVQLKQAKDRAEFNVVQEQLTTEEFRRVLDDLNDTDDKLEELLVADKDVISKVKVTYDTTSQDTTFEFPEGIMPLSITLNGFDLYFKDGILVNRDGHQESGYSYKDYGIANNKVYYKFHDDVRFAEINNLLYLNFKPNSSVYFSSNILLVRDSYHLFYPVVGGTKLYQHEITNEWGLKLTFISTIETACTGYSDLTRFNNNMFGGSTVGSSSFCYIFYIGTSPYKIVGLDSSTLQVSDDAAFFEANFTRDTVTEL